MKKYTIIFLMSVFCCNLQAQSIDNMKLKCLYKYDYTYNTMRSTYKRIDTMMLEIGKNACKFYSYKNHLIDSMRKTITDNDFRDYGTKSNNLYIIYVNYPKNKTTVVDNPVGTLKYVEYVEDFEIPQWTIYAETQKILSHTCKKATCRFRGRDYTAWYAVDIPISRGPYKFAGLPGLILKIADSENLYGFECIGIEKDNGQIYKSKQQIETVSVTREEFIKMEKRFYGNPKTAVSALKSLGLNLDGIEENIPDNAKVKYNLIELE